uniref:Small ribosomal subunit protein uS3c n=1 Tax=prasinophyte sp. MBIC10622 TaxID=156113 RepID=A0A650AKH8_9CHLO|nr:ribosomal protein S3 [prasinophyte sp. MBIC10622]
MGHKVHPVGIRLGHAKTHDGQWHSKYHYTDLVMYEQRVRAYIQNLCRSAKVSPGRVVVRVAPKHCVVQPIFTEVPALPERSRSNVVQNTPSFHSQAPAVPHLHDTTYSQGVYDPVHVKKSSRSLTTLLALWMKSPTFFQSPEALAGHFEYTERGVQKNKPGNLGTLPHNALASGPFLRYVRSRLSSVSGTSIDLRPIRTLDPYESAQVVADSVAHAIESGVPFKQIFRGLLDEARRRSYVRGLRIRCSGRLQGAEIARIESRKEGQTPLHVFSRKVDFAVGEAYTTYGIIGVKVWICYHALRKK